MKLIADYDILILPGTGNSDPDHWQAHWCQLLPNSTRVLQDAWESPRLADWLARLDAAVRGGSRPAILVGHSRSCCLIGHWSRQFEPGRVVGALLVGPTDMDGIYAPHAGDFRPMALDRLKVPAIVAASSDDPYATIEDARRFATAWGADFADVGPRGHINAASRLECWAEGLSLLGRLLERIER